MRQFINFPAKGERICIVNMERPPIIGPNLKLLILEGQRYTLALEMFKSF